MLHEIKSLSPVLHFPALSEAYFDDCVFLAFSDASQGKTSYGQTGYIGGIYVQAPQASHFYAIDWQSSKQARVSFSSVGAEILAAAESADRASLIAHCIQDIFRSSTSLPLLLTVDSHGLYSTITTLHEGRDYRLRPTVSRLRDSFETGEIKVMQWIPGSQNLADALTKRNVVMYRRLNVACSTGQLDREILSKARRVSGEERHGV